MAPEALIVDVVLTWLASLGVAASIIHVHRRASPSFMETRIRLLLYCLFLLLVSRGFAWLYPDRWTNTVRFIPSAVFPLALTMFAEGLLRRHMPLLCKLVVSLGTVTFSIGNLFGVLRPNSVWMLCFIAYFSGTILLLGLILLLRKRETLSPPENRFVDALVFVSLIAAPLVLTDFTEFPGLRLGSLGALVFVCVCLRVSTRRSARSILLGELWRFFSKSAVIGLILFALFGAGWDAWLPAVALAAAFVLTFSTWSRVSMLNEQSREQLFLSWIVGTDVDSLPVFLETLSACPVGEDHVVVEGEQLEEFDSQGLARRLLELGRVLNIRDLQKRVQGEETTGLDSDEQLLALLETHGMTHVFLAEVEGPVLVLLNYPQIADGSLVELEMAVVQKLARLAPVGEPK